MDCLDLSIIFKRLCRKEPLKTPDIYITKQPHITTIYCGYYDGAIKFKDGEATGIEVFSLAELKEEIANYPERFTEDLKFMIEKYGKYLIPVSEFTGCVA
ncbi:MAG: hypothetical protein LBD11_03575 [Candidatus Peribacteria bacterium]|nr:hypothetical protein [Candidatus Peribacteria bacterium]